MAFFDTYCALGTQREALEPWIEHAEPLLAARSTRMAISSSERVLLDHVRTLSRDDRLTLHRVISTLSEHARKHWLEGCPVALAQDTCELSGAERVMVEALRHLPGEDLHAVRRLAHVMSERGRG